MICASCFASQLLKPNPGAANMSSIKSRVREIFSTTRGAPWGVHLNPIGITPFFRKSLGVSGACEAIALLDEAPKPHDIARRRGSNASSTALTISKPQMFDMADHHLITAQSRAIIGEHMTTRRDTQSTDG